VKRILLAIAVSDFVLLFPAAVFMAALIIRNLPLNETAPGAQQIVMWYAGRLWTLWVLLLALPLVVLITGCVALFRGWIEMPNTAQQPLAFIRAQPVIGFITSMTLCAAGILVIVLLHMLAN
jgi:hypothetical protein